MKIPNAVLILVLTLAATAHADDAALDALCAAGGGQLKRVAISGVQRLDCGSEKVSWFQVRSPNGNLVGHYEATRDIAWRPAIEAAVADLAVVCGELPPQIQFAQRKLIADCGSDRK
ncbi:MAG: hypothetical protein KJ787_13280 [Gammaproteobacteria bacterium]|nr:hypothetical protein [Gammaproteobacteria bacterium]MBU1647297.1 hypothetical protein [Gammaproteobacteria bacterium]MBU1971060.1 hypothetical protein [Gammaproteobacteria bacterium]